MASQSNCKSGNHMLSIQEDNHMEHECCICLCKKQLNVVFDCDHRTCLSCFKQYAITKLNSRQFRFDSNIGYSLGCPHGCLNTLLQELHVFRLMDKLNYERYKTFAAEEYVLYHQGVICPMPSCGCGLILDESNLKVLCPLPIGCGKTFCRSCKELWKDESLRTCPCQDDKQNDNQLGTELSGSRPVTSNKLFKKCPTCSVRTEKDGGCNAISCIRCGTTWCWICETEFRTDCIQLHWFS